MTKQENYHENLLLSTIEGASYLKVYMPVINGLQDLTTAVFFSYIVGRRNYFKKQGQLIEDTWFYSTYSDVQDKLYISKDIQRRCIKELLDKKLISVKRMGLPAKQYFKINIAELDNFINDTLSNYYEPSSVDKAEPIGGNIQPIDLQKIQPIEVGKSNLYILDNIDKITSITFSEDKSSENDPSNRNLADSSFCIDDPDKEKQEEKYISFKEGEEERDLKLDLPIDKKIKQGNSLKENPQPFSLSSLPSLKREPLSSLIGNAKDKYNSMDFSVYASKPMTPTRLNELMNRTYSSMGHTDQIYRAIDRVARASMNKLIKSLQVNEGMSGDSIAEFIYTVITKWGELKLHPRLSNPESRAKIRSNVATFWDIYNLHRELVYILKHPMKSTDSDIKTISLETFKEAASK